MTHFHKMAIQGHKSKPLAKGDSGSLFILLDSGEVSSVPAIVLSAGTKWVKFDTERGELKFAVTSQVHSIDDLTADTFYFESV